MWGVLQLNLKASKHVNDSISTLSQMCCLLVTLGSGGRRIEDLRLD